MLTRIRRLQDQVADGRTDGNEVRPARLDMQLLALTPNVPSVKFATMMHDAVHSYLESHDVSSFNIQAIALEGQGEVEDRVNKLYSQLVGREEWLKAIKMADAIFVATHSQGSVVSTQLLARMLDQGLITGTQTHLYVARKLSSHSELTVRPRSLAMCGIAQGPCASTVLSSTKPSELTMFARSHVPLPVDRARALFQLPRIGTSPRALRLPGRRICSGHQVHRQVSR